MALEPASVCGVGAALHWFFVRPSHAGSLLSLFAENDIEFYGFAFAHAPLNVVQVVLSDRCLVDQDIFTNVFAIDGSISVLDVKPLNGSDHLLILVTTYVDKAVLDVIELPFGIPLRSEDVAGSAFDTLNNTDEWASSHVVRTAPLQLTVRFSSP